jgi:hypothetical protein
MSFIQNKLDNILFLFEKIKEHYSNFQYVVKKTEQGDIIKEYFVNIIEENLMYQTRLQKLYSGIELIDELKIDKQIQLLFEITSLFVNIDNNIEKYKSLCEKYNPVIDSYIIDSNITSTNKKLNDLVISDTLKVISDYQRKYNVEPVISEFLDKVMLFYKKNQFDITLLQSNFHEFPSSILLYKLCLQTLMDNNRDLTFNILQMIEIDKNNILDVKKEDLKLHMYQNPIIRTCGLKHSKPFHINEFKSDKFSDFKKQLPKKHGIIIIYNLVNHPLEFNTKIFHQEKLDFINIEYINNNRTIIERENSKWDFTHLELLDIDLKKPDISKPYIIIETNDMKHIRYLTPWVNPSQFILKYYHVSSFINYLNGTTPRIQNYNKLCESEIKKHLNKPFDTNDYILKSQSGDAPQLKQNIMLKLEKLTEVNIKKKQDIYDYLHNSDLADEFIQIILNEFKEKYFEKMTGEYISTFLTDLQNLRRIFMKILHDNYESTDEDLKVKLVNHTNQQIRKCLDEILTNKSNIYQNVIYKQLLLSDNAII